MGMCTSTDRCQDSECRIIGRDSDAGIQCQVSGVWFPVLGLRSQVLGVRSQVLGARSQLSGARSHLLDIRLILLGWMFFGLFDSLRDRGGAATEADCAQGWETSHGFAWNY